MDQWVTGSRDIRTAEGEAHVSCTPPVAAELFEISVLDTTGGDGHERWHTIGWGVDREEVDSIAETYVTRPMCPYDQARIRHQGLLVGMRRRPRPSAADGRDAS
ncbi:hypothetical protein ETD86_44555 [Nonomuraea turkmeniaca]|uniref:Uncharacterized protein n=1 Tax=Nonomuraea turkmeniaca TaxID=103838 RepID=A0A5S4F000_9ACTN|nr:hypothetical protein [Nonomuraea turkmeniaca]TMR09225.1 hypothetical protein ETD86_44555 [Nonomuraea turkmeniaca]